MIAMCTCMSVCILFYTRDIRGWMLQAGLCHRAQKTELNAGLTVNTENRDFWQAHGTASGAEAGLSWLVATGGYRSYLRHQNMAPPPPDIYHRECSHISCQGAQQVANGITCSTLHEIRDHGSRIHTRDLVIFYLFIWISNFIILSYLLKCLLIIISTVLRQL